MNELNKISSAEFKTLRALMGLSINDVADATKEPVNTISKIDHGSVEPFGKVLVFINKSYKLYLELINNQRHKIVDKIHEIGVKKDIVILRYKKCDLDIYYSDIKKYPEGFHGALVADFKVYAESLGCHVSIIYFDARDYRKFLIATNKTDTEDMRTVWAMQKNRIEEVDEKTQFIIGNN